MQSAIKLPTYVGSLISEGGPLLMKVTPSYRGAGRGEHFTVTPVLQRMENWTWPGERG